MKKILAHWRTVRGSEKGVVFVTVAVFSTILFVGSLSYMDLITGQSRMMRAGQNQLEAQTLAEAGVEEAAWQYNYDGGAFTGWASSTDGAGHVLKTNTVNSFTNLTGTVIGGYTVVVDTNTRIITSTGQSNRVGGSNIKTIKAYMTPQPLFGNSITTKSTISLTGNAYTDSYNSTAGVYGGSNRLLNGDVQTNAGTNGALTLSGNTIIKGDAGVGTGGTVASSGNASITGATSTGVANTFNDVTVPSSLTSLTPQSSIDLSGNNSQTIAGGSYRYPSISTSGNSVLTINGDVVIYLTSTNSLSNTGNSNIRINSGSSLTIYTAGNVSISGNGIVNNNTSANPLSFKLYGTPTNTAINISGNGDISGVINAPQAQVTVTGNGNIFGAVSADTYTSTGNGGFHYDENLANNGPIGFYKLGWTRLTT